MTKTTDHCESALERCIRRNDSGIGLGLRDGASHLAAIGWQVFFIRKAGVFV